MSRREKRQSVEKDGVVQCWERRRRRRRKRSRMGGDGKNEKEEI